MRYLSLWPEQKLTARDFWRNFDSMIESTRSQNDDFFSPALDVSENKSNYVLKFDIPGINKIEVRDNTLFVSGERAREEKTDGEFTRHERFFGRFERALSLPESVDADKISAQYFDGVLTLDIPKVPAAAAKRIQIK
jgi:HSP20 family protein